MMRKTKILFVLKKRYAYGEATRVASYGLNNSCRFVCEALSRLGIESKITEVVDGNSIDKAVHHYKPTHVFLEAIWVEPRKLRELLKLHHKIEWFVRIHSKVEFLAHEGMSFAWIKEYGKIEKEFKNFNLAFNNLQTVEDVKKSLSINSVYAPNVYLFDKVKHKHNYGNYVNIGCFGAIREFKNHINQALAALEFANKNRLRINFHINTSRFEKGCEGVLKNLRNLFLGTEHRLTEHPWMNHSDFLKVVNTMDLGMQVSFTETFSIVSADFVSQNVPLIGSDEIEFLHPWYKALPNDVGDIADKLEFAYLFGFFNLHRLNERGLNKHNNKSVKAWGDLLDEKHRKC